MLRHWTHVFSFTFSQYIRGKGFKYSTWIVALLILVSIPVIFLLTMRPGVNASPEPAVCNAETVIVYDSTGLDFDWQTLGDLGCPAIAYQTASDSAAALQEATENNHALVLTVTQSSGQYTLTVILPDGTALAKEDADGFSDALNGCFGAVLAQAAGMTDAQIAALSTSVTCTIQAGDSAADQTLLEIVGIAIPYVILLLLYFLILFYGQGVANSVILEKSSKLMDTFLVSVHPAAMVMGKLLAIAAAGIFQLLCWVASLAGGLGLGILLLKEIAPGAETAVLQVMEGLNAATALFSPSAGLIVLAFVIAGFLMYCALAAIGGSLASKQEDLSSTNLLFSLILVVSFLVSINVDTLSGTYASGQAWIYYIPFTAVLTVPGRLLLGEISILQSLISLGLTFVLTFVLILAAGKTYILMSFWNGNPPSLKKLFRILIQPRARG